MTTYPIPDTLADAYRGAGWALAAILNGQVVAIRYIDELADVPLADQMHGDHAAFFLRQWSSTTQGVAVIREMQALGQVSMGMLSGGEFTEL